MDMDIKVGRKNITAHLSGEIDHHTSEQIRNQIDEKILQINPDVVNIDLSKVTFMDSSGIGIIVGRYKKLKAMGGVLRVLSPKPQVRRMIEMSGIQKLIEIV